MPTGDYIFSGDVKQIIMVSGVTTVDVQDMYSRWKEWIMIDDNSKFDGAFRTFGGDPTIAGQFAPRYYFLTNLWRVVVNYGSVSFGVNLYTDELEFPYIVGPSASVSDRNSDAVIVDVGIAETLDYNEKVTVNSSIGVSGVAYPIGTAALPVNNIADALLIATERSLHIIQIFGSTIFDVDVEDFVIHGGNIADVAVLQGISLSGSTFKECVLVGSYTGLISGEVIQLADGINCDSGIFSDSGIQGVVNIMDGGEVSILNCSSMVPGNESPSLYLGNDISLNLRKYSGGIAIYDCDTGTTATLEFLAGNCMFMSGNTGGVIEVRGIAKITDNSSGTTIGTEGLLVPYSVATQHSLNVNTEITKNK